MSESLSKQLHDTTVNRIIERLGLTEVTADDGGPLLPLISQVPMAQGQVGQVRVYKGPGITKLLTCTITVPAIGLDSHMQFAFTDTEGAVPHFTVDSVRNGDDYAFHLDLIPRLDLGASLAYMDAVYTPLTETFKAHRELEGLSPAQLDPRQYAVMSPWMLVNRANEAAFRETFKAVETYLEQWFTVLDAGVPQAALQNSNPQRRAERDAAHRGVIFNAEVDKVWNQITPLIGAEAVEQIIAMLRDTRG